VSYREVTVIEIKEVLRLWLRDEMGLRKIADMAGVDRKTVRRYVEAGEAAGVVRDGGEGQLTDELLGLVVEAVRPRRPSGRGASWQACEEQRPRIQAWLDDDGLELTKVKDLLARRGVVVPYSTLHRFAGEELGYRRPDPTVPVADGEPGGELQIDFGRMGLMFDVESDRRRTRSPGVVRPLRRYYGAVRLPVSVHPGRTASAFSRRPATNLVTGRHGTSRFSRMKAPCMHRFSDRAGSPDSSR
jgi:transposase